MKSPKETYIDMKKEIEKATNMEEINSILIKYVPKVIGRDIQEGREDAKKQFSTEQMAKIDKETVKLIKEITPSKIKNIDEKIDGKKAVLTVTINDGPDIGTISMINEDGWKLEEESWEG